MNKNEKIFYVCSYGGSGSHMLCKALNKYGNVKHIHSRIPPDKLEYIGNECGGNTYSEWFNSKIIPDDKLHQYYVIFIYRNPSFAIPSRFTDKFGYIYHKTHLKNIQGDTSVLYDDVLSSKKDLYKIGEFYYNYTKLNKKRNYKIICLKYEDIFEKQKELSELLKIGDLNLKNKSSRKESNKDLDIIYADLIEEMKQNEFIMIN